MKHYTVTPNKDATTWFVKIEDVAPTEEYDKYDKAINAAVQIAEENSPSKLSILDKYHEVVETRTF
ncbi:hypothetical protein CFK37_09205 [Virgibacillus phasianinus]|uniref:DUF2188 domain-containing protein n=1 Tax=Virgibacillus phasianinus TaxID=2017483 RepID=A0A220U2K0_9BACI|nr:DUF2188 domain-containing protein [Virgibacillus phasianinus]ASK62320.1 hypothetical protein CFK37_09205 [Virgibacillus phasianinus]